MRSFLAALRSLVLPYGSTSGQRIILDGVNGRIDVYDVNNDLPIRIDPEGIKVFDANGALRIWLAIPTVAQGTSEYSIIEFLTDRADETNPGIVSLYDTQARNRMVIAPGENAGRGAIEWTLLPEDFNTPKEAMLQAVCYTLDHVDNLRPTIDLTGASSQAGLEPLTVVHDLAYGDPNAFGSTPTVQGKYPKGAIAYKLKTTDTTLSTTAGTYTDVIETPDAEVKANHVYMVTMSGSYDLLTGGSGFATSDTWAYKLQRSLNSGSTWQDVGGRQLIARSWVATGFRYIVPPLVRLYTPNADAPTVRWKVVASKLAGAGTVTSVIETDGGGSPIELLVEDCGVLP